MRIIEFKADIIYRVELINNALKDIMTKRTRYPEKMASSMEYSLLAEGKRIRPILCLEASNLVDGNNIEVLPIACAIEMIHAFSLIHDDLPCIDNDEYRRGRLTNHKVYGEAFAVLAGDGLLNLAYEIMIDNAMKYTDNIDNHMKAMKIVSSAVGINGMLGGQALDILSENEIHKNEMKLDEKALEYIHSHKTGALLTAPLAAGLIVGKGNDDMLSALMVYGKMLGLTFQIVDDILDIEGSFDELGKLPGSDEKEKKLTYPELYGMDKSKKMACEYTEKAKQALEIFGDKNKFLLNLADFVLKRRY